MKQDEENTVRREGIFYTRNIQYTAHTIRFSHSIKVLHTLRGQTVKHGQNTGKYTKVQFDSSASEQIHFCITYNTPGLRESANDSFHSLTLLRERKYAATNTTSFPFLNAAIIPLLPNFAG